MASPGSVKDLSTSTSTEVHRGSDNDSTGDSSSSTSDEPDCIVKDIVSSSDDESKDSTNATLDHDLDVDKDSDSDSDHSQIIRITRDTNPTDIRDIHAIGFRPLKPSSQQKVEDVTYGLWMVFRPFTLLDETWHKLRKEVEFGVLSSSTTAIDCSCMYYAPSKTGPGSHTNGVICIYTSEGDIHTTGFILIKLVKHDIKYKTIMAFNNREYAWKRKGQVSLKTLYWNDGEPSFDRKVENRGPNCYISDEWNLNRVVAPQDKMANTVVYGYWEIVLDKEFCLTSLWQLLRRRIEARKFGPVEMICPPKRDRRDPNEKVVFLLYTAHENIALVGTKLAKYVRNNIYYNVKDIYSHTPAYDHKVLWRQGEPVYVMSLIK